MQYSVISNVQPTLLTPDNYWARLGNYPVVNRPSFRSRLEFVMSDLDLRGKSVLDIGGGVGWASFYAAAYGADRVICLEPAADGAKDNVLVQFQHLQRNLNAPQVELRCETFQQFSAGDCMFDVVLLINSINHLDELACQHLKTTESARKTYDTIATKLYNLTADNGSIVITDVSSRNLFSKLPVANPVAPTIEWHKHQPPEVWDDILCRQGFRKLRMQWTPLFRLGRVGPLLTGNGFAAYCLTSHFRLVLRK